MNDITVGSANGAVDCACTVSSTMGMCRSTTRARATRPRTAPALSQAPEAPVVAHNGHVNDMEEGRENSLWSIPAMMHEHLGLKTTMGIGLCTTTEL